ncbi:MAG: hypothetical protein RLN85_07955, partial [Pseudomonadales bacterium]
MKFTRCIPVPLCILLILAGCGPDKTAKEPVDASSAQAPEPVLEMPRTPSPPGARIFFITPFDGETVPATFAV